MQWFVQEKNPFGGWSPAIYNGSRPDQERVGHKRTFKNPPVAVPGFLMGRSLDTLARCLAPGGELYEVPHDALKAFLNEGVSDVLA